MTVSTTQDSFHPMRGHVADGTQIQMRNGDTLTIKATTAGWQLVDQDGRSFGAPTASAHVIDCLVYNHPNEDL